MSKRQKWTPEEDETLRVFMRDLRADKPDWERLANKLLSRGIKKKPKQIRERWTQHLHPRVTRGSLSRADCVRLFELHSVLGCHWKQISEYFPGRTDNFVKNVFFAQVRKSLRKARKLSNSFSNPDSMKMYRPLVLTTFLTDEIPIPKNLLNISKSFSWVKNDVINSREFVLFFSQANDFELQTLRKLDVSELIDSVFAHLEILSHNYNVKKEKNMNARIDPSIQTPNSLKLPCKSIKMLAREFLFYFRNLEKDLQGTPRKDDMICAFDKISECASEIKRTLLHTNEIKQAINDLSSMFIVQPANRSLKLSQEDMPQNMGLVSLSQTIFINPKKSSEKLNSLLEQSENLGLIKKFECSLQNSFTKMEDFSKFNTVIEDTIFNDPENINSSGPIIPQVTSSKDPKSGSVSSVLPNFRG